MLPSGWTETKIGEVLTRVKNPVQVAQEQLYREIGIRSHGKGIFHKKSKTGLELGNKSVFWIEPDCFIVNIVFAWEQAVAKTSVIEIGFIASHRFPMYRPLDNKVDIDFLLYLFNTKRGKFLLELASPGGAGRNKTLGQKEFSNIKLQLPSQPEQTAITDILSTWDRAAEQLTALLEAKREHKRALMQRLLTGKQRLPEFMDDEWEEIKLDSLGKFLKGSGLSKGRISLNGNNKCILYGELYTTYDEVIRHVVSTTNAEDGIRSIFGDILIPASTTTSGIDLAIGVALLEDNVLLGGDINIFRPNLKLANSEFLSYMLTHIKKFDMARYAQGVTIIHLYGKSLKNISVSLPSLEEQTRIAAILSAADAEISQLEQKLTAIEEQKKGLMQQLLTGKKRVALTHKEAAVA